MTGLAGSTGASYDSAAMSTAAPRQSSKSVICGAGPRAGHSSVGASGSVPVARLSGCQKQLLSLSLYLSVFDDSGAAAA